MKASPSVRPRTRLGCELLEDRTVPSGVDVATGDPNDWPMFGHDSEGTRHNFAEQQLSPATVGGLEVKWAYQTDGPVTGTPAVVNDRVYAADLTGSVYSLTRDGELLWRQTLTVPSAFTPKITSSPLVTNRTVVLGDTAGQIHGLDVETGEVRWTTRPSNPGPVFGDQHPLQAIWGGGTMVGNYVAFGVSSWEWLVGSDPSYPGFTFRGNVVLIDPADGRIVWQTFFVDESTLQPDGSFGPNGVTVWGSPAYDRASNTIFVGTGQHYSVPTTGTSDALIALNAATGEIKWVSQKTAGDTFNFGNFDPNDPVDSDFGDSPQLYRLNGRLVVAAGQKNGFFHVADAETGVEVAPPQQFLPHGLLGGFHIESGVAGGVNYATGNYWANAFAPPLPADHGAVFAISGDGTDLLWKFDTDSPFLAGVAIANGVVYAQELDGEFHAIDASTGAELAKVVTGSGMSGPAISRGQIYLGDGPPSSLFNLFGVNPPGSIIALGLPASAGAAAAVFSAEVALPPAATQRATGPTVKGPVPGALEFDAGTGLATFEGSGHLTLMGKVAVHGEFLFAPGDEPDSLVGTGVAVVTAANGDVLVANVLWFIDPQGEGTLEFRWPGEVTLRDGTTVKSTGRFVELPFAGLRGTSTVDRADVDWGDGIVGASIKMTGEIVDPDPLD